MSSASRQLGSRAQPRRLVGWIVLLAFAWGWLAGLAHLCAENHRLCAAHGVVEHASADLPQGSRAAPRACDDHEHALAEDPRSEHEEDAGPRDDGAGHEACSLLLLAQAKGAVVAQSPTPVACAAPAAFVRVGVRLVVPAAVARPPFTYAPKHSPPGAA